MNLVGCGAANVSDIELISQSLCKACGLCCDGTIYSVAKFAHGEERKKFEAKGIKPSRDMEAFSLPCAAQADRLCSLYGADRPNICGKYKCKILRRVAEDTIAYGEAAKIIQDTLNHSVRVRASMEEIAGKNNCNLRCLYIEIKSMGDSKNNAALVDYVGLHFRLHKYFFTGAHPRATA